MNAGVSVCPFPGLGTSAAVEEEVWAGVGDFGDGAVLFRTEAKAFAVLVGLELVGNEEVFGTPNGVVDEVKEKALYGQYVNEHTDDTEGILSNVPWHLIH